MNTYTVLSRLMNGEVEARNVSANYPHLASASRRQFCSLPEHHVGEVIDVTFGPAVPHVVLIRKAVPTGEDHGYGVDPYERITVLAGDERQAMIHADAITPDVIEMPWAQAATPAHVHVDSRSRDCDGLMERSHTEALPVVPPTHPNEGERSARECFGAFVADRIRGLLMYNLEFTIGQHGADVYVVDQPSEEGGSSICYQLCDDDLCDEFGKPSTQRDHFAERMRY